MTLAAALQLLCLFGVPAALLWAEPRLRAVRAISPVVLCYTAGILTAQLPGTRIDAGLAHGVIAASVLLAIPLLLFSSDLRQWLRLARPTVLSFGLAVLAVCLSSALAFLIFGADVAQAAKISGMLSALYSGGTPNMNAVALALNVDESTVVLMNAADVVLGSVFLLILMTVAKPLLARWFPPFVPAGTQPADEAAPDAPVAPLWQAISAVSLSAALGATAAGASWLILGRLAEAFIILGITTLAIACTLSARVRRLPWSYESGQYLLLVFCVSIGSQADLQQMLQAGSFLLLYAGCVLVTAVLLHLLMARFFGIDVDTLIITATAAFFGPPFVGPIARVLGNREVVVSGITAGVFGLAIGNYLGYAMASLLSG